MSTGPAEVTLRITDDDEPPEVTALGLTPTEITESGAGNSATVTASLSHPSSVETTVDVSAAATDPTGFTLSPNPTLTFPANTTASTGTVTITATDDEVDAPPQTVQVTLTSPQGVTIPTTLMQTLTITDDDPPEVTGESAPAYIEGGTGPVATYTASNPADVPLTWSLEGDDANAFTISNGVLRFTEPPDYEASRDSVYQVTVKASDGTDPAGTLEVTVAVLDALGKVELPPSQPQVEVALTATLSDLDGLHPNPVPPNEERWCWERFLLPAFTTDTADADCPQATTDIYTPVTADLGHYLRVTVTYTDGQGTRKAVKADTDEPVALSPPRPRSPVSGGGSRGGGGGSATTEEEPELIGYLENPGVASPQSGIRVISGWVCEADEVEVAIGHLGRQVAAYGTERLDTADICGDTDNGFGLLFNWNLLGDGEHEVVAFVDGVELSRTTVTVTDVGSGVPAGRDGRM